MLSKEYKLARQTKKGHRTMNGGRENCPPNLPAQQACRFVCDIVHWLSSSLTLLLDILLDKKKPCHARLLYIICSRINNFKRVLILYLPIKGVIKRTLIKVFISQLFLKSQCALNYFLVEIYLIALSLSKY